MLLTWDEWHQKVFECVRGTCKSLLQRYAPPPTMKFSERRKPNLAKRTNDRLDAFCVHIHRSKVLPGAQFAFLLQFASCSFVVSFPGSSFVYTLSEPAGEQRARNFSRSLDLNPRHLERLTFIHAFGGPTTATTINYQLRAEGTTFRCLRFAACCK